MPGPHNDPAKPPGTWCSRTWWHWIDFVAVPREWFAAVKRAEVESSVVLPETAAVGHVMFPSKVGPACSRILDASCTALRRPEVHEQVEHFWSHAPLVPFGCSVDEHADLLVKAAQVARERAEPQRQSAPQADWMDDEARQEVRTRAAARRVASHF